MRWVSRVGTAVIAVLFVAGPPLAAITWVRGQHWRWPTAEQAQAWIEQPRSAEMILAWLALVAALLWLLLAVLIVRSALAAMGIWWRRLRRMPLPSPAQVTAGSMAGVAALALPTVVVAQPVSGPAPVAAFPPDHAGPDLDVDSGQVEAASAGFALPGGGWIPYRTALAVTALSGLIWLHRRHRYQPGPPRFGRHFDDDDLRPLPVAADAITAALPPDDTATLLSRREPAGLQDLPAGRLVLAGPGADDAARGLLVTAVLDAALTDGDVEIGIRREDLERLLDVRLVGELRGVRVDDPPAESAFDAPGIRRADREPQSVLVVTHLGKPTVLEASPGAELVRTVVNIGGGPEGTVNWYVSADGTVRQDRTRRLCTLGRQAANDLLQLVGQLAATRAATPATEPAEPPSGRNAPAGRLTLLGDCGLYVAGEGVRPRRSAGMQILAYLAVHPDGATTTELLRVVWPGVPASSITKRLHTTLTDLRSQLQPLLGDPILRRDDRYHLSTAAITTDLHDLHQAIIGAMSAFTRDERQAAGHAIIDGYRGDLGAGYSWPWLHPARETLRREVIDACLLLAANAEPADAARLVRAATGIDPYNADLHRRAHTVLSDSGDHAGAAALQRAYEQRVIAAGLAPPAGSHQEGADLGS